MMYVTGLLWGELHNDTLIGMDEGSSCNLADVVLQVHNNDLFVPQVNQWYWPHKVHMCWFVDLVNQ